MKDYIPPREPSVEVQQVSHYQRREAKPYEGDLHRLRYLHVGGPAQNHRHERHDDHQQVLEELEGDMTDRHIAVQEDYGHDLAYQDQCGKDQYGHGKPAHRLVAFRYLIAVCKGFAKKGGRLETLKFLVYE